jgi:3',5'-cyclic AMP phosphodiesterase CpdA
MPMFRLAHLSDPHLGPLPKAGLRALASKRVLGLLSWHLRRRHIHVGRSLQAVAQDVRAQGFDHIAVTGDLANISLPQEFHLARAWLDALGPSDKVTVVPGNHDAYVGVDWERGLRHWAPFMTGDDGKEPKGAHDFPFLRVRGPVALIGLSTAQPASPLTATGAVGGEQLAAAETLLRQTGADGLFRIVLIHHPPQAAAAAWRKRLRDAPAVRDMLGRAGAELVLHGHLHRSLLGRIAGPMGDIPVMGVVSASTDPESHYGAGGYHALSIERRDGAWRLGVEIRRIELSAKACHAESAFTMDLARAA